MALRHSLCSCCLSAFCALFIAHVLCDDVARCPFDADEASVSKATSALMQKMKLGSWAGLPRAAIVSASYGGRAAQAVLPQCPQDLRCVLYTDEQVAEDGGWLVSTEPYHAHAETLGPDLNSGGRHSWNNITDEWVRPLMAAKFYKMNMFLLPELAGIEVIMWHDADWGRDWFHSGVPFADRMHDQLQGFPMLVEKHAWRSTVEAEIPPATERVLEMTGYWRAHDDMAEAYEHQTQLGFTDDALYNCAKFLINSSSPILRSAFLAWWHEVQDFSFRDQVSFPYIVQHFNLPIRVLEKWHFHQVMLEEQE